MSESLAHKADIAILEILEARLQKEYTNADFADSGIQPSAIPPLVNAIEGARKRRLTRIKEELTYKRRQSP